MTGVTLRLPFGLVALAVPCGELGPTVTIQQKVFCNEQPVIKIELTHRPARTVDTQTLNIPKRTAIARLLVLPLARPVLKVATVIVQENSQKSPEMASAKEAAAGAAAAAAEVV